MRGHPGAVIASAGTAAPSEPVLAVSGFLWDRLLRPAQQRMHFFQEWAEVLDRRSMVPLEAAVPEQPSAGPSQGPEMAGSFSYSQVILP